MSNILLCIRKNSSKTYGRVRLKNFSNIYDDQVDSDVLALTNDYSFDGETNLREFLKER